MGYRYLKMAAEQDDNAAWYFLGEYHAAEEGEKSDSIAFDCYMHSAQKGHKLAQAEVATFYEKGRGVVKNDSLSIKWYMAAAEKELPYALYRMGLHHEKQDSARNLKGRALKKSPTFGYMLRAAEKGVPDAQFRVAEYYATGRYIKKNKRNSFVWYERAAKNGYLHAQEFVAECYEKGRGTEKNDEKAYQWYKKAAERGSELGKIKAKEFELFMYYR
jgi:TPR repeat protein